MLKPFKASSRPQLSCSGHQCCPSLSPTPPVFPSPHSSWPRCSVPHSSISTALTAQYARGSRVAVRAADTTAAGTAAAIKDSAEPPAAPSPESIFKGCDVYAGPVAAIHAPGKGMGLGATRSLSSPGELLLVSAPLAAVAAAPIEKREPSTSRTGEEGEEEEEAEEGPSLFVPYSSFGGGRLATSDPASGGGGPWETESSADALVAHSRSKRYTPQEVQWLEALAAGAPRPSQTPSPVASTGARDAHDGSHEDGNEEASSSSSSSSGLARPMPAAGSSYIGAQGLRDQPLPPLASNDDGAIQDFLLESLVKHYSFQLHAEDFAIAQVQGREPAQQVAGIWPEQALLNHSCVPSTISYASRGVLITRLTRRSISGGAELFHNYLGDEVMAPLEVRQKALLRSHGFVCACARCKEESRVDGKLMQLITDVYDSCAEQVREDLEDAIADGDFEALQGIKMQLAAFVEVVDAAFTKSGVSERTQIWLQAGLMQLYESLFIVAAAQGERDLRLSEMLQALAGAIQPGGELHVFWARTHLQSTKDEAAEAAAAQEALLAEAQQAAAGKTGGKHKKGRRGKDAPAPTAGVGFGGLGSGADDREAIVHADKLCLRAYQARYGPISRRLYQTLLSNEGLQ